MKYAVKKMFKTVCIIDLIINKALVIKCEIILIITTTFKMKRKNVT